MSEKKYPIGGFAPGNYGNTCTTCKKEFIGDKRAVQCEPCAEKMMAKLMSEKQERKSGWYWVRNKKTWDLSKWSAETRRWDLPGISKVSDEFFDEINETPIEPDPELDRQRLVELLVAFNDYRIDNSGTPFESLEKLASDFLKARDTK